jgi:FkbM family methyltransferase
LLPAVCADLSTLSVTDSQQHNNNDAAQLPSWRWAKDDGGVKYMITDSLSCSRTPLKHQARSFSDLPDPDQARSLLAEIARAPCPFSPVLADRPLALYGAGNLGRFARDVLNTVGCDFDLVIDRNARELAASPYWTGVRLLHPDDVDEADKSGVRVAIGLVNSPYVAIERSLLALGFKDIVPFYDLAESFRHLHPLSNGWFAPPLAAADEENTCKVLALWGDDASRAHHLQFLAWRRLREEWTFESAPPPNCSRFFIPEVTRLLHASEILLDAGAHHGSVTWAFLKQSRGAFRQIVAIEPDASNRARLEENLQSWLPNDSRITVCDSALAAHTRDALFHDGLGYASQLSDTGCKRVSTQPLDALGVSSTFVKLHLEGAELAALKGAQEMLVSCRPIVAATIYHNADGIWETPLWLMETLRDYDFLFRADSWCGTGAVVYCLPKERCVQ